jgi:hypothetical protein
MSRPSFPPTDPQSGTDFPPRGPVGWFPRFSGTIRYSDSLPPIRPRFVAFAWPYRAWALSSLPGEGSPPAWVSALVTRLAVREYGAETTGPPRFLDIPPAPMPRSRTPVESPCQANSDTSMLPSTSMIVSASTFHHTIEAPSRSLGTPCVRFAAPVARTPRNTRFRLVASLCRAGLDTRRDAQKVSEITMRYVISSPLSRLGLAQHRSV